MILNSAPHNVDMPLVNRAQYTYGEHTPTMAQRQRNTGTANVILDHFRDNYGDDPWGQACELLYAATMLQGYAVGEPHGGMREDDSWLIDYIVGSEQSDPTDAFEGMDHETIQAHVHHAMQVANHLIALAEANGRDY